MTRSASSLDDILIIIVLFRQSLAASASYQSLNKALIHRIDLPTVMVYDNSPNSIDVNQRSTELLYVHDPSNPGVSKAYNEAYKVAKKLNKKWLLLADQDTQFPSTIFSDYVMAMESHPDIQIFAPSMVDTKGLVSPFQLSWGKGRRIKFIQSGVFSLMKSKLINSGLLISLAAFERASGYDERFQLDYSDISFCDHLVKNNLSFVLTKSICHHMFSATQSKLNLLAELERFKSFCDAACLYKEISTHSVILIWIILPHALKLSLQRKDFKFLKMGLKKIFSGG